MANGPELRVSNVLGTPVFQWVINQLGTRAENNSRDTRDDSNLIYLANKTGWFRIVSSVRIPATTNDTQDINVPNVFNAPNALQGIPTLIVALFFFGGIQLFFLGLIGEYVLSIHSQVRRLPREFEVENINFK
jgi:hypothetical protein